MKDILLLLSHYPSSENTRDQLTQLLLEVRDWPSFVNLINSHGIIALAAYNIKAAQLEPSVPHDAMTILENGYRKSMIRNLWLAERWKEVNSILEAAGIKHILLKGMALEHTIYESKGLRQMTDTDILIKREEAERAWELLQKNGFKTGLQKSSLHRKILMEYAQHLPTLYKDGYILEIHVRLFDEIKSDLKSYNEIFDQAPEIRIGQNIAFLLPEDIQIKYLVKHFNRHALAGECQLRLYTDIKMLDPQNSLEFPDDFIPDPVQRYKIQNKKAIYRENIRTVPAAYRLRFIAGDLLPSISWMKSRYNCSALKTIIYYPHRLGKIIWLFT